MIVDRGRLLEAVVAQANVSWARNARRRMAAASSRACSLSPPLLRY
jgi:hypothetical protein